MRPESVQVPEPFLIMLPPIPLIADEIVPVPVLLPFSVSVFAPRVKVPVLEITRLPVLPTSKNVDVLRASVIRLLVIVCVDAE